MERKEDAQWASTNKRRLAGVVNVQKVAVEVQVLVPANLDCGVGGLFGKGARRECHLGKDGKRSKRDLGQAFRGELGIVDDDILDVRMRRPSPVGSKWRHMCDSLE